MNRDYVLSREDIRNKDKLFKKIRNEKNKLNDKLYYYTSDDPRTKCIRNFKIYNEVVKTIFPYVLSASVVLGSCSLLSIPFVRDIRKDSISYNCEDSVDNFILTINSESYVLDGNMVRNVSRYKVKCNKDDIDKILRGNYDCFDLELLSKDIELSDKVYNKVSYLVYHDKVVYSLESNVSNMGLSILYVILTVMNEIYSYKKITGNDRYRKLEYRINEINYDYDNPDINTIKKKLKISEDNYKYLMRK